MRTPTLRQWKLQDESRVSPNGDINVYYLIKPDNNDPDAFIASLDFGDFKKGETHIEEAQANAARIVQCVNACAGIEDPAAAIKGARFALESVWGNRTIEQPATYDECLARGLPLNELKIHAMYYAVGHALTLLGKGGV